MAELYKIFVKNSLWYRKIATLVLCTLVLTACGRNTETFDDTASGLSATTSPSMAIQDSGILYMAEPLPVYHTVIYDEYLFQNYLYYLADEGTVKPFQENDKPVFVRIDLDNPDEPIITPIDVPANHLVQQIALDDNGVIHILAFEMDGYDRANIIWYVLDSDGNILKRISIGEALENYNYYFPQDFIIDSAGNAYMNFALCEGLFIINPEGELVCYIPVEIVDSYYKNTEGKVNILYRIHRNASPTLALIDLELKDLKDNKNITVLDNETFSNSVGNGKKEDYVLIANNIGVSDFGLSDGSLSERFKWKELDIRYGDVDKVYPLMDGRKLFADRPNEMGDVGTPRTVTYSIIRPMTPEDIIIAKAAATALLEERTRLQSIDGIGDITLGVVGWYSELIKDAVDTFNINNPGGQIEIIQYGTIYGDDMEDGIMQLNLDIIGGKCPDILIIHPDLSFGAYATMGVFRDLYPYLDYDVSFNYDDFQENIIRAYEMDGKLFALPVAFHVNALAGKAAELGDTKEWKLDDLITFVERYPDNQVFWRPTKTAVLELLLKANGENIVDWKTGTSAAKAKNLGFDREIFIKMLTFAGRYIDEERYSEEQMAQDRIDNGDIKLMEISATPNGQFYMEIFKAPTSFVGYPSESGNGFLVSSHMLLAISSICVNNETAWNFIQYLLSEEYQSGDIGGYPLRKSSLEQIIAEAQIDSGASFGAMGGGLNVSYIMRGATDEEVLLFRDLISRANKVRVFDRTIDKIIMEEATSYFSGQKSAKEVADIVENRVGIYVMETR